MKVVFLGNHTVGVRSLQALLEQVEVVGVVAHPVDIEDGIKYESVYQFSQKKNLNVIRGTGRSEQTFQFINDLKPDLLWITDYRYIIPANLLETTPLGAVNIHPSLLPKYRGRASINWAIINGEKEIGLTAHFIDNDVDTGDIIEQIKVPVSANDYVGDVLNKCYPLYYSLTQNVIEKFIRGDVKGIPQINKYPFFGKRVAEDGKINWDRPLTSIYNLIRAVSHPYPGAFTEFENKRIFIWKAKPVYTNEFDNMRNGIIIENKADVLKVKCPGGVLDVSDFSFGNERAIYLHEGDLLQ